MVLVHELRSRSEIRLEPDILLQMMAVLLIREDENPNVIDHKLIDLKVNKFKAANEERAASFFIENGLGEFIPFLKQLDKDWMNYLKESMMKIKLSNEILATLLPEYAQRLKSIQSKE